MASFSRAGQTRTASSPVALQKQSEPMQLQAQELQRSSAPYPIAPVSSPTATTAAKLPATTATGMSGSDGDASMFVGMSTAPTVHVSAPHVAVSPAEPAPPSQSPPPTTQKATDTPSSPPAPVISPKNANPSTHPAPVEVCSTIKDLANEVISSYETQARDLAAEYAYLFEEERSMNAELEKEEINGRMLQQKVEETEMEQAKLAEAEDFESADALSAEVQIAAQRVHSLRESIAENEEATATNRRNQSLLLDTTVKGLSNLRRQQIEEVEKFYEDNRKRLKKEDGRISMEEERVSMERSGVAREESALEEERQEIETAIHAQTEEVQQDKTDMEMRLMGVTAEIRNLEKLLAEKRQQEKDLKRDLSVVESKID
ncbi:unnamed protein product, partial [Symbiodinium microadriaticum]